VKPYYEQDGVTIYHGDCREVLPSVSLPDAAIIADPPYGISYPGKGVDGNAPGNDHGPITGDGVAFDPGHMLALDLPTILWGGIYFADALPRTGGWLVWDKLRPESAWHAQAEIAWTNCVNTCRVFRYLWHGMIRQGERNTSHHPTQKPLELMAWCIRFVEASLIVDPYIGAGATLVAAKNTGRRAIGIEIEERYCEIAAKRLSQTVMSFENETPASGDRGNAG